MSKHHMLVRVSITGTQDVNIANNILIRSEGLFFIGQVEPNFN